MSAELLGRPPLVPQQLAAVLFPAAAHHLPQHLLGRISLRLEPLQLVLQPILAAPATVTLLAALPPL